MKTSEKVQIIINTLEILNMPSTYDNVNRMLGIYDMLQQIKDDVMRMEAGPDESGVDQAVGSVEGE